LSTSVLTIVDDYIQAALHNAVAFEDDDGFLVAYLEVEPGIRAHGDTLEACRDALVLEIEDWVRKWLRNKSPLPVLDGIDLTSADSHVLEKYHRYSREPADGLEADYAGEKSFIASLTA
jgi:predicted RNase H-like HicB family nuclease